MSAAGGACLLLSLAWASALGGRPPLPYLVWPSFVARGLFLLAPLASSAWSLVSLVVAANVFGAAAGPAQAAVVGRLSPRASRAWRRPGPRQDGGCRARHRARARRGSALRARGLSRDLPGRCGAGDGREPASAAPARSGGRACWGADRRRPSSGLGGGQGRRRVPAAAGRVVPLRRRLLDPDARPSAAPRRCPARERGAGRCLCGDGGRGDAGR